MLWVLDHFTTGKIVIALDSMIVNDAIKGVVRKWKDNGWRCSTGPVGNVHCWAALLRFLNMPRRELRTVLLASHCDIRGNEVANDLAELGRSCNPLNVTHTDRMRCRAEMKLRCPGGSDLALDLTERQLRQTLIQIFTLMWIWKQTEASGAHRCPHIIKTLFLRLMNQKGICP